MIKRISLINTLIVVFALSGIKSFSQDTDYTQIDSRYGDVAWKNQMYNTKWKFFDKRFCNIEFYLNYKQYLESPFNHKYINNKLISATFNWWQTPHADKEIVQKVNKLLFRPSTRREYDNENFYVNVRILHYLGLKLNDFKKLRWFFSKEDVALYPEKIYSHFNMLADVSKKYDYEKLFIERVSKGIPVVVYEHGASSCYYIQSFSQSAHDFFSRKRFRKIIYLKVPHK